MAQVSVIGAGTMGHSLAQVFAMGRHSVVLNDISEERLAAARKRIAANLDTLVEAGQFDPADRQTILHEHIRYTVNLAEAVSMADLVIETVPESKAAKKAIFEALARHAPATAILASNTSYLNIFGLADGCHLEKVLIAHWFNPPHIIPLVEIVPGPQTSPETIDQVLAWLKPLGKEPIVLKEYLPGFIGNRLQAALNLEAYKLIDDGHVTPEDLDRVVRSSFGLRIPILALMKRQDFTGLDLVAQILRNRSYAPPPVRGRCDTVDALVAQGRLGVKSGHGFYHYKGATADETLRERDLKLLQLKNFLSEMGELPGSV